MKDFFRLVKYEILKVYRNKTVIILLMLFSFCLLVSLSFSKIATSNKSSNLDINIGICLNGQTLEDSKVVEVLEDNFGKQEWKIVEDVEEGKKTVNLGKLDMLVVLKEGNPQKAVIYYDELNNKTDTIVNAMSKQMDKIIYQNIVGGLSSIGFIVNEEYFDVVDFVDSNKATVTSKNKFFSLMVMVSVGIVLMFGLAYSMARDNENNSIKTILYMPIRSNRYLLIKMVPYIILGLIQLIISLLIGHFLYKIDYQINIFLLVLIAMLYVLSSISLGLIFGMMKSQISAALLATFVILFPAFDALTYVLASLPKYLMFIQYLIPGKVFSLLLNGMMFGGVIIWWQVIALACQTILFYLIAFLILKRKVLR